MKHQILNLILCAVCFVPNMTRAELVVIVNGRNTLETLSAEQVKRLFLRKQVSFESGSPAIPIDQPSGPDRDAFYQKLTGKDSAQIRAYWSKIVFTGRGQPPKEAASAKEVLAQVTSNPTAIGYVDRSLVDESVKVVLTVP